MNQELEAVALKIKKLLALAGSANEHEAQAAAAKAMELATQHNLSIQQIESVAERASDSDPYVNKEEAFQKTVSHEERVVAGIVDRYFFVRTIWTKTKLGTRTAFLGRASNIEIAEYVAAYLVQTFNRLWKERRTQLKRQGFNVSGGVKIEYVNGLAIAVRRKLEAQRAAFKQEQALMVIDNQLQAFVDAQCGKTKAFKGARFEDHTWARRLGVEDGASINLNQGLGAAKEKAHKELQ